MSVSLHSIAKAHIPATSAGTTAGASTVKTTRHTLTVMTSPNEPGRAKASALLERGSFRKTLVGMLSSIGLCSDKQARNTAMENGAKLIDQFKALNKSGTAKPNEKALCLEMNNFKNELADLKASSPKDYAAVSCMLEDAIAALKPDQLTSLTSFLENNRDTSEQITGWGNEFRSLSLLKDESSDHGLHTIIGQGVAKNLAVQLLNDKASGQSKNIMTAYEKVADTMARNCPGLSSHIIANVLLFEHHNTPAAQRPPLDKDSLLKHPLNAYVAPQSTGNTKATHQAQMHVIQLAQQKLESNQA